MVDFCCSPTNALVYFLYIGPCTTRQNGPSSFGTRILNVASRTVDAALSGLSEERVLTRGPFRCVGIRFLYCFFSNFQQIYVPSEHIIAFTGYEQSDLSGTLHIPDFDRSRINAHCAPLPLNSSFTCQASKRPQPCHFVNDMVNPSSRSERAVVRDMSENTSNGDDTEGWDFQERRPTFSWCSVSTFQPM
jgi:hypothetical protein